MTPDEEYMQEIVRLDESEDERTPDETLILQTIAMIKHYSASIIEKTGICPSCGCRPPKP